MISRLIVICMLLGYCQIAIGNAATSEHSASQSVDRIAAQLKATDRTSRDLKAVLYVENAHGQLDEWTNRLVSRLELGIGPRLSDPMIDGRSGLQVLKLKITYAGYAQSDAVTAAIEALADAHDRRLTLTRNMMNSEIDRQRYAALSQDIDELINLLRHWSHAK